MVRRTIPTPRFPGDLARLLALALLVPAVLASCRRAASDPVRAVVDRAAAAAEARDAGKVADLLSPAFAGPGGMERSEARSTVARALFGYESVEVSLSEVSIERGPDRARCTFRARFSGAPKGGLGLEGILPRTSEWRFAVVLAREGDDWRVAEAAWERGSD